MGPPKDLAAALRIPEEADASQSPLPPDIPIIHRGFSPLSCPIGPLDFCKEVFQARLAKVKASLDALRDMGDSQLEIILLHSCLALPKVFLVLRICPPSHICHTTIDFDTAIHRSLESIIGGPMSDWS